MEARQRRLGMGGLGGRSPPNGGARADDVTETPELGQAQIPSHPGMKYPVRESPHFDLVGFAQTAAARAFFENYVGAT